MTPRRVGRDVDAPHEGVLVIDKEQGPTSHDVVASLRRILGMRRIGHCGTLDPLATGVLVVCLGRYTRLADRIGRGIKEYETVVELGATSDTDDTEGILTPVAVPHPPSAQEVEAAVPQNAVAAARASARATPWTIQRRRLPGPGTPVPGSSASQPTANDRARASRGKRPPEALGGCSLTVRPRRSGGRRRRPSTTPPRPAGHWGTPGRSDRSRPDRGAGSVRRAGRS